MLEQIQIVDDKKFIHKGYIYQNENGKSAIFYCKAIKRYLVVLKSFIGHGMVLIIDIIYQ